MSTSPSRPTRNSGDSPRSWKKPERHKLPEAAALILESHFAKYPEYPSLSKRKELLAEVHKIPGGEWYGLPSLYQWFKTRIQRKRDDDDDDEALRPTDRILWPSLTAAKMRNLEVLLRDTPNPTPVHLQIWSSTLEAELSHVEKWVQIHRAQAQQSTLQLRDFGQQRDSSTLPTPEGTASPEPNSPRVHPALASPISSTVFQQTYIGYGVPIHIGATDQQPYAESAFMAVQPSSSVVTPSSLHAPLSPVASTFSEVHGAASPALEGGPAVAPQEEVGSRTPTPTGISWHTSPFKEFSLPPDTPEDVQRDESEDVESAQESYEHTEPIEPAEPATNETLATSEPLSELPDTATQVDISSEFVQARSFELVSIDSPRSLEEVLQPPAAGLSSIADDSTYQPSHEHAEEPDHNIPDEPSALPAEDSSQVDSHSPMDVDVPAESYTSAEDAATTESTSESVPAIANQAETQPKPPSYDKVAKFVAFSPKQVQTTDSSAHTNPLQPTSLQRRRVRLRFSSPILPTDLAGKLSRKQRRKLGFLRAIALSPQSGLSELPRDSLGSAAEPVVATEESDRRASPGLPGDSANLSLADPSKSELEPMAEGEEAAVDSPTAPSERSLDDALPTSPDPNGLREMVPSLQPSVSPRLSSTPIPTSLPGTNDEWEAAPSEPQPMVPLRFSSPIVPTDLPKNVDDVGRRRRPSKRLLERSRAAIPNDEDGVELSTSLSEVKEDEVLNQRPRGGSGDVMSPIAPKYDRYALRVGKPSSLPMQEVEAVETLLTSDIDVNELFSKPSTSQSLLPEPRLLPAAVVLPTPCPLLATSSLDTPRISPTTPPAALPITDPPPSILQPSYPPRQPFWSLCDAIREKLAEAQSKTPSPPPTTFEEFGRRMEENARFYEAIERGEFAGLGLVPSKRSRNEVDGAETKNLEGIADAEESTAMDVDE